jgi:hypothetical protein
MERTMAVMTGVCMVMASLGAQAAEQAPDPFLQRMVLHTQGWGVMGHGVAAHAPDKEPLPLRIKDTPYAAGIGTHAPSETILMLDGQFETFTSDVGVQWIAPDAPGGTVVFRVLVDGQEAFNSGVMTMSTDPKPVRVDVRGAGELRLIVESAGDDIYNDLGNWANATLTPDPQAREIARGESVDVAPFAQVMAWDPAQMEGTKATRLETMPAEDLFPGVPVTPKDGVYEVPAYADGAGSIGLEWLERRRLSRLELEFADAPPALDGAAIQFWRMAQRGGSPGGSKWQGAWVPMKAKETREGNRWIVEPQWENTQDLRGVLKVRWVFPAAAMPARIRALRAYTLTRWETAELLIQSTAKEGQGSFEIYNGLVLHPEDKPLGLSWNLAEPLRLTVRYSPAHAWEMTDRTVLRFSLPDARFGVAVDDALKAGTVYVEHAGLLVSRAADAPTPEAYRQSIAEKKTLLEQVREMPEQTAEQAFSKVYRPDADLGPTMLSLAADNRKFIVEREGTISFDDRPEIYGRHETPPREAYSCKVVPSFGQGKHDSVKRAYQRDWLPVQVLTVTNGGLEYRQRTFVAPFPRGERQGTLPWLQHGPLGVAEFRIKNPGAEPAAANLAVRLLADAAKDRPAEIAQQDGRNVVTKDGKLLAVLEVVEPQGLQLSVEAGTVRLSGDLAGKKEAQCVVYLPRWEGATVQDLSVVPGVDDLVADTQLYWQDVMSDGMQVEVPDKLFNNLIPASQMHCLLAARNEDGERIAPWIASIYYGPLESEGHSILRGMAYFGHLDFVRRGLEYYIARYNDQGFLTTGYTVMGTGWHLWTLGEYYTLTRDKDWLRRVAPQVERVCKWIMAERRKTMKTDPRGEKVPEYGLMPPGVGADWEVYAYYFYLNGYYCAGLASAAQALADIGWEGAGEMLADAAAFREDILRAYDWVQSRAPVFALRDGTWVPEYPTHVYSPMPIEYLYVGEDGGRSWCYDIELGAHHLIPMGILPANSPQARWIMDHEEGVQFLRPGWFYYEDPAANEADWFNLGGFAKVQPYYARTGEVYALQDDVKPFIRTYFNSVMSLLNREDLSLWEHFMNGAYNKTHETGYFLHQTRLMLVQERADELWLAPFIPSNWLRQGMRVAVDRAPTYFGKASYTIESRVGEGYTEASIFPPKEKMPKAIVVRLPHPLGRRIESVDCDAGAKDYAVVDEATVRLTPNGDPISLRVRYAP